MVVGLLFVLIVSFGFCGFVEGLGIGKEKNESCCLFLYLRKEIRVLGREDVV